MMFPAEPVPDGTVAAIHHLYTGVVLALLVAATTWDDPVDEDLVTNSLRGIVTDPFGVVTGGLAAVGLFALAWPYYPIFGASGTLAGLAVATVSLARPYWRCYRVRAVLVFVSLGIAWDDAVSHAFGYTTPLDWTWMNFIYPYMA